MVFRHSNAAKLLILHQLKLQHHDNENITVCLVLREEWDFLCLVICKALSITILDIKVPPCLQLSVDCWFASSGGYKSMRAVRS